MVIDLFQIKKNIIKSIQIVLDWCKFYILLLLKNLNLSSWSL